ncbi:L-lysine 6-transaminase [Propionicicella superfundia]|uniref:L-lysine 6-transaminase n=1 Tax=Propionicicella superfundia TaxID=348582 RepID=UPI0003FA1D51|nr:L-lysine 6-transaminase [Propionicicella superfundia]
MSTIIPPARVHETLARSILADGLPIVLDLDASSGSDLVDARDGSHHIDLFSFFASNALGLNHPALRNPQTMSRLGRIAVQKPSNSDLYTVELAEFVATFARVLGDPRLPHLFFIEGGALAVENALKVAFDYKSRLNESRGLSPALGTRIMHLTDAFHGRSGYTLSLTNTDPNKTARFPTFDWPRITSPYLGTHADGTPRDIARLEERALAEAEAAFAAHGPDIAAFIAEPIQGEGGDHHFRPEFLQRMQRLTHDHDALFIMDEVQTGVGMTGTAWAYQQLGLEPDVVAFGKKAQVCGVMAGGRVDDIPDNVFAVSSRINSTWGGNLTDMVRARIILETIESDHLIDHAAETGDWLLARLEELALRHPLVTDPRGRGLMCAFSLPDTATRDEVLRRLTDRRVLLLGCGRRSVRFRPALTIERAELAQALDILATVLADVTRKAA